MARVRSRLRKLRRRAMTVVSIVFAAVVLVQFISRARELNGSGECTAPVTPVAIDAESLLSVRTNPALAGEDVEYDGFCLNFNSRMHVPNWVAWELTADETTGNAPRYNKFAADSRVEGSAEKWDYNYSGYDRGHMAPAGDMKWSEEAMRQTFFMTNICPQAKSLNTGAWKRLEEKCRQWARADSSIVIICGPVLTDSITEWIGDSRVAVPERFFKVILAPGANPPRGIGFVMPNGSVAGGIQKAAMSIDEVEAITGHDFFAALPDSIENAVESQNDFHYWSTLK